jgi:peptidoglycan/xylan/chitin deacetylase (PgdA/CDA1 family)
MAAGGAAAWSAPAPAPVLPPLCTLFGIRRRLDGAGIALTFDDGPHPRGTPAVLDALARHGVSATFFLVGEQVERDPSLAAEIVAAGHAVALHGHAHRLLLRRTPAALERDLDRALFVIESATGISPSVYRPPYGVFSSGGLALCRRRGWAPTLWSRWGRDWGARETPTAIARRAAAGVVSGDIVLLHDSDHYSSTGSWQRTAAALPAILDSLLATGAPLVTLPEGSARGQADACPFPFVNHAR